MKVLVTGANGYLGQGIIKKLHEMGHNVVATDYKTNNVITSVRSIACDLFKVEDPYEYFGKPEVLLHLAWRDGFVHYSDAHIQDLPLHYQFIEKMSNGGINKISIMGSMHEIGFYEGSVNEDTKCNPTTPYGIGKNALRQLVYMLSTQKNFSYQWFRGYYIVGNSQYGSSIFSKITAAVHDGKKEFPFTQGLNQFDFIDYKDFCEQVVAGICQSKINGIINICTGRPEKLSDRVERFIKENNYDITLKYGAFPDRPYDSKAIWGDDSKIKKILKNSWKD